MGKSRHESGGHAFPTTEYYDEKPIGVDAGMTLRDYFAAQALQGMIASSPLVDRTDSRAINKPAWAAQAYGFADAMLAERIK